MNCCRMSGILSTRRWGGTWEKMKIQRHEHDLQNHLLRDVRIKQPFISWTQQAGRYITWGRIEMRKGNSEFHNKLHLLGTRTAVRGWVYMHTVIIGILRKIVFWLNDWEQQEWQGNILFPSVLCYPDSLSCNAVICEPALIDPQNGVIYLVFVCFEATFSTYQWIIKPLIIWIRCVRAQTSLLWELMMVSGSSFRSTAVQKIDQIFWLMESNLKSGQHEAEMQENSSS